MQRLLRLSAVLSLVLATSATMLTQTQKDAHIGTWKLNVAKSKFNPGPGYKSETRTYEATADGYKFQGERVNPDGSAPKIWIHRRKPVTLAFFAFSLLFTPILFVWTHGLSISFWSSLRLSGYSARGK